METNIHVRNVSDAAWHEAKIAAMALGIPLGRFVTDALWVAIENARRARQATGQPAVPAKE